MPRPKKFVAQERIPLTTDLEWAENMIRQEKKDSYNEELSRVVGKMDLTRRGRPDTRVGFMTSVSSDTAVWFRRLAQFLKISPGRVLDKVARMMQDNQALVELVEKSEQEEL